MMKFSKKKNPHQFSSAAYVALGVHKQQRHAREIRIMTS